MRVMVKPLHRGGVNVTGLGIIDTGATNSCISPQTISQGRFNPTAEHYDRWSADGLKKVNGYSGFLEVLDIPQPRDPLVFLPFVVGEKLGDPAHERIIALVGTDVLRHFMVTYEGPKGTFTLEL